MICPKCLHENPEGSTFCGKCATKLSDVAQPSFTETLETSQVELTTGSVFAGRYQVIEELGKGGMGKVYRVLDKKLNEEVALKLIKPEIASDKKTLERFKNELKLARKVVQKNVGRMFDLGEETGTHYITMEYVPGEDLKSSIRRFGQLPIGKSISITKQLCEGLAEAHGIGIVHRDLKPSNIMIDKNGNARIMDFGIARSLKGKGITGAGVIIGTPEYMSPEQVDGKDADQRSDIYSLAVILYEMLTGRLPFEGETPLSIAVQHRSDAPKDPKEFNANIPDDLARIILKCLEKKPEDRFQTTAEIYSEFIRIEQGLPTTDRKTPKPTSTTSKQITVSFTPKKMLVPVAAILMLIMVALFLWKPWGGKDVITPLDSGLPSLAVLNFTNNTGDSAQAHLSTTLPALLIDDLSQSSLLTVQSRERLNQIYSQLDLTEATSFNTDNLREIAHLAGVKYVLTGHYSKFGETYRINFSLLDASTGNLIKSERSEGQGETSIYGMVDDLTRKIKSGMNLKAAQIASDQDKEVGTITTRYPEAYRLYNEGRTLFLQLRWRDSILFMEKAIAIDPDFAMAYRSIGVAYGNMGGHSDEVNKYITLAMEKSDRLSHREQLYIQSLYVQLIDNDDQQALAILAGILKEYPEDFLANQGSASIFIKRGDFESSIPYLEVLRRSRTEFVATYNRLGEAYMAKGDYEKAREVYRDYMEYFGESADMQIRITDSFAFEGRLAEALQEADKVLTMSPISYTKGGIYHLNGDFKETEELYREQLEDERTGWKMNGWRWLEYLYRMLGQYEKGKNEALAGLRYAEENNLTGWKQVFFYNLAWNAFSTENLDEAFEWADKLWVNAVDNESITGKLDALGIKMRVNLERNQIDDAKVLTEEIKRIVDDTRDTKDISRYLNPLGLIEKHNQNYEKAIERSTQTYDLLGRERSWYQAHVLILNDLALAYYLNGDLEAARREYENILSLTTGRLQWGDLYVKSYYHLGQIHEELGNRTKAVERYEQFLDLWKDADSGLPEVADARQRLAGLKRNGAESI